MRVLLLAYGTRGDVAPHLALAKRLGERGHRAAVGGPGDYQQMASASGVEFIALAGNLKRLLEQFGKPSAIATFKEVLEGQLEQLAELKGEYDIVVGSPMVFSYATVADVLQVPFVAALFSVQWLPSRAHHPPIFVSPPRGSPRLTWWMARTGQNAVFRSYLNRLRGRFGLKPVGDVWSEMLRERPLVAADVELSPLPDDVPVVEQTGSWLYEGSDAVETQLEDFLAEGPAPIYLGFGSMAGREDPEEVAALAAEVAHRLDARVVVQGAEGASADARVFHAGVVSHRGLFKRCRLIVHHGGAGTYATAARAGVPQLVCPFGADQFLTREQGVAAGVVQRAPDRRRLRGDVLADLARMATSDAALRGRAAKVAELLDDNGPDRAVDFLESMT